MRRLVTALLATVLLISAAGLTACGSEEELEVVEGEPVELGDLHYNVQITRFLNPQNTEDATYLEGVAPPKPEEEYLAVFLRIENEGEATEITDELKVVDTRGTEFEPIETESVFALELGDVIEADGELPAPGTPAASGPIKGAAVLFLVTDLVTENRPLELEIPGEHETGTVELDI